MHRVFTNNVFTCLQTTCLHVSIDRLVSCYNPNSSTRLLLHYINYSSSLVTLLYSPHQPPSSPTLTNLPHPNPHQPPSSQPSPTSLIPTLTNLPHPNPRQPPSSSSPDNSSCMSLTAEACSKQYIHIV